MHCIRIVSGHVHYNDEREMFFSSTPLLMCLSLVSFSLRRTLQS